MRQMYRLSEAQISLMGEIAEKSPDMSLLRLDVMAGNQDLRSPFFQGTRSDQHTLLGRALAIKYLGSRT